jgi:heparosan-N-sulfate-glucuronate 5-epimerase
MAEIDKSINLGIGNISMNEKLGMYYQDISGALIHISSGSFAKLDDNGIPYRMRNGEKEYYFVLIIQYGIMCYDLLCKKQDETKNKENIIAVVNWLDEHKEYLNNAIVWRSNDNIQYNLKKGWISGMYQGQAISLYLRAYQLTGNSNYLKTAEEIFKSFDIDFEDGGFKRIDKDGNIWFEEYPTQNPSFVLNGFIYSIFGLLDLYRVTKNKEAKRLWDACIKTLVENMPKYDVWYWSVYDQLKQQLVSYYYQKNVHIPLMEILFGLTQIEIFDKYAKKWKRNLNNPFHRFITKIMYRVQPKLKKYF